MLNALEPAACVSKNHRADARLLKPCIFRSRLRVRRRGPFARLFPRRRTGRRRSVKPRRWSATLASHRFCTIMLAPHSLPATRQIYTCSPPIDATISSRCQRGDGGNFRWRRLAAIFGPNFNVHARQQRLRQRERRQQINRNQLLIDGKHGINRQRPLRNARIVDEPGAAVSRSASSLRPDRIRFAPAALIASASAAPIPDDAPVIRHVLP